MMLNIMVDISRITQISQDHIWVYVCNLAPTDMVEYGMCSRCPGKRRKGLKTFLGRCNAISAASARPTTTSRFEDARVSRRQSHRQQVR